LRESSLLAALFNSVSVRGGRHAHNHDVSDNAPDSRLQAGDCALLLVVPPQRGLLEGFSTGLIAIANYVRRHQSSIKVSLLDFGLLGDEDLDRPISEALLGATGRVFVGITGTTASYQSMLATARAFKRLQPSCVVVMGGHHVSAQDEIVLSRHREIVDFVIRGEGEVALTALLRFFPEVSSVPSLSWWDGTGVRRNAEAALLKEADLDQLPPTFEDTGLRSAAGKFGHVTYVSARGCPLKCAFCVVGASPIRAKSIEGIIGDLRYLVESLGYRALAIEDNFFGHQPKRTLALCAAIERLREELDFDWDCQTRVESMRRPDVVQAMARAGCTAAYLGVESLVPKHLTYLGKTPRPDRYLSELEQVVLPNMLAAGLDPYLNLQLGLFGEVPSDWTLTESTLRRLGKLSASYRRDSTVFPQLSVIYPGTPHFEGALAKGMFGSHGASVFEEFTAWEAREEPILNYLGEHFAHGVGGIPLGLLDMAALARGRFEFSPHKISSISTQLRRMEELEGVRVFRYGRYLARQMPEARAYA
jgi:hypothetical protein